MHLGNRGAHEPNRLIWGDNLHIMRSIPSNTVDLIYIDPPFFSGRTYNVIWGDNHELRSFNDIWEGGLDGYLIWLNARLYEMKRILKPTGSIYVHCDWHASHYIKVEMDKIFGYENFRNEIVWCYRGGGVPTRAFARKHDIIFLYTKHNKYTFHRQYVPYSEASQQLVSKRGGVSIDNKMRDLERGATMPDWWIDINSLQTWSPERMGYPTQKPKDLLERLIHASSNPRDIVADFFVGGGTTAAVAQRLNRRFIACDQSRVAVAVTAERLKQESITLELGEEPRPDFTVEQWGIYEAEKLSGMPVSDFREFTLTCYGATRKETSGDIHGWRNQLPIWVGLPELASQTTAQDVQDFANAILRTEQYKHSHLRNGEMLAWGFRTDAVQAAEQLRERAKIDVNFVNLAQIHIGDDRFRAHITKHSTERADYRDFLTFVRPPVVSVGWKTLGGKCVTFDASESAVVNPGAEIINVQWDFDFNGERFTATPGYSFQRNKEKSLHVTPQFNTARNYQVACRVQDSMGGEGMWTGSVDVL